MNLSYKIAIASSDGKNIDISFGATTFFYIYDVDGRNYSFLEKRNIDIKEEKEDNGPRSNNQDSCASEGCKGASGCGTGTGCAGGGLLDSKVDLIGDCRSVICKKINT